MDNIKLCNFVLQLSTFVLLVHVAQGSRAQALLSHRQSPLLTTGLSHLQSGNEAELSRNSKRLMIGSTVRTCTYNECRGCKYKCRSEQVPVEGNDPINSAYHYKCVCHRW